MLELAWTTFSKKYVMLHFLYTLSLIDMSLAYKCVNLKNTFWKFIFEINFSMQSLSLEVVWNYALMY